MEKPDFNARELVDELELKDAHIARLEVQIRDLGGTPVAFERRKPILFKRVNELEFSARSQNALRNAGIEYVYQLVVRTEAQMLKSKYFARTSINEIKETLDFFGLFLGMELPAFPR